MKNKSNVSRETLTHEYYMLLALKEAEKAYRKKEIPVGCIIVKNNKIITKAYNKREKKQKIINHAELIAITKANKKIKNWRLDDCDIYVTLEPCPMCAGAIGWAQIPRIVYGAPDEKRGYRKIAPNALHPKAEVVSGVLEDECRILMQDFFKKKR